MKNKGFSLVELIIVIAIMAILAAAIAPALIRYIDKSRKADDLAAAETINTAVSAALANEDAYSQVAQHMDNTPLGTCSAVSDNSSFSTATYGTFFAEVNSSMGGTAPKIKYTKESASTWSVGVNTNGKPVVWLGTSTAATKWELQPTIDPSYK